MKLNRLMLAGLLSLSLSATSAYACDNSGGGSDQKHSWFSFWHHCDHDSDSNHGSSQSGGHQCNGGGSSSGSGSSSSSGTTGSTSTGGGTTYK